MFIIGVIAGILTTLLAGRIVWMLRVEKSRKVATGSIANADAIEAARAIHEATDALNRAILGRPNGSTLWLASLSGGAFIDGMYVEGGVRMEVRQSVNLSEVIGRAE